MTFLTSIKALLYLAVPTIIGHIGLILTIVVDTIMVAQYSTEELTFRSASNIIHFFLITITAGFTQGIGIICANLFGKASYSKIGNVLIKNTYLLLIIGIIGTLIYLFGNYILLITGQDINVIKGATPVIQILGIGFIPCVFYFAFAYFLESLKKPYPVMITAIITNIANIILNRIFIFGGFGISPMGAVGSAITTVIVEFLAAIILLFYIVFMKNKKQFFNKSVSYKSNNKKTSILVIGLGVATVLGIEELSYATNLTFAGWISGTALAIYSLTMNVFMVCLTISIGIAEATSVLVGISNGKKDFKGIKLFTINGLLLNFMFMIIISISLYLGSIYITALYTNDPKIIYPLYSMLHIVSIIIFVDSSQVILSSSIRGLKLVAIPTSIQIFSSLGVMIPAAWFFALYKKMEITGLLLGIFLSSSFSLIVLSISFYFILQSLKNKYIHIKI